MTLDWGTLLTAKHIKLESQLRSRVHFAVLAAATQHFKGMRGCLCCRSTKIQICIACLPVVFVQTRLVCHRSSLGRPGSATASRNIAPIASRQPPAGSTRVCKEREEDGRGALVTRVFAQTLPMIWIRPGPAFRSLATMPATPLASDGDSGPCPVTPSRDDGLVPQVRA